MRSLNVSTDFSSKLTRILANPEKKIVKILLLTLPHVSVHLHTIKNSRMVVRVFTKFDSGGVK